MMYVPSFLEPKNTPDILFSSYIVMAWPTQTEAADPEQTLILILTNELVERKMVGLRLIDYMIFYLHISWCITACANGDEDQAFYNLFEKC